jgi:hypothetical protein
MKRIGKERLLVMLQKKEMESLKHKFWIGRDAEKSVLVPNQSQIGRDAQNSVIVPNQRQTGKDAQNSPFVRT